MLKPSGSLLLAAIAFTLALATPRESAAACQAGPGCTSPNCVQCEFSASGFTCSYVFGTGFCGCRWIGGEYFDFINCNYTGCGCPPPCTIASSRPSGCSPWGPQQAVGAFVRFRHLPFVWGENAPS